MCLLETMILICCCFFLGIMFTKTNHEQTIECLKVCGCKRHNQISLKALNRFNQVVEAKRFEGVFLCRKVC